jgi:HD-GYP domain-containing protein (c-di-GMP phosphodiesterase class II)
LGHHSESVAAAFGPGISIEIKPLREAISQPVGPAHLSVFLANLGSKKSFEAVKACAMRRREDKFFILPTHTNDNDKRLKELGAAEVFVFPLDHQRMRTSAKVSINRQVEASWINLVPEQHKALTASLACFQDFFNGIKMGEPLPRDNINSTCRLITASTKVGKLNSWIDSLQGHHDYSFQHSMFVCGSLAYFGNALGMGSADLETLTVGGLIHDVGKSLVPLAILDKPGKLDQAEWDEMRRHPEHSREILLRESDLDDRTISMAVHHHEKLDGNGYPDGLSGAQISDLVRLTAICDVYSALIDRRSYKEPMTNEGALDLMATFRGHLDLDLLKAFREFVLDRG